LAKSLIYYRSASAIAHINQKGVTLIELLLVLTLIGLAATTVILNAPPTNQNIKREAERFAARMQAAHDKAILTNTMIGLIVKANSYEFAQLNDDEWVSIDNSIFRFWQLDETIKLKLTKHNNIADLKDNDLIISRGSGAEKQNQSNNQNEELSTPIIVLSPFSQSPEFLVIFSGNNQQWQVFFSSSGHAEVSQNATS